MSDPLTLSDVVRLLNVSEDFVVLLESEAIITRQHGRFTFAQVERIRVCWGLHEQLGLNLAGVGVALHLLERLDAERRAHREVLRKLQGQ